ncbi:DUF504 domain-containing protein [Candidatus Woesearchaeota archaeon]|nr:DUF504 domain-containing protein [Candidatus Woesearchaeota archaeon]
MISIKDLLNKIKWDKKEDPSDYTIVYKDRVEGKYKEMAYNDIKKIEGTFMVLDRGGEEVNIPLHRVKQVRKNWLVIWNREKV